MKLDAFEVYQMFMALRNHFNQKNYDYFRYQGKVRITKDKFLTNKDKFKYAKLARNYDPVEMQDFILANILVGKKWIGEFLDDDAVVTYKEHLKRKQSLSYMFDNELSSLFSSVDKPENVFKKPKKETYPEIINANIQAKLSIESLCIINSFIPFVKKFDDMLGKDDYLWSVIRNHILKYTPFLDYDREKFKLLFKKHINSSKESKENDGEIS